MQLQRLEPAAYTDGTETVPCAAASRGRRARPACVCAYADSARMAGATMAGAHAPNVRVARLPGTAALQR